MYVQVLADGLVNMKCGLYITAPFITDATLIFFTLVIPPKKIIF